MAPRRKLTPLPFPERAMSDCGLILGKRGAGKSAAARVLFEHEVDSGHRAGMIDPMGDSAGIRLNPDETPSRFQNVVIFGGPNGDVPISDADGGKVARIVGTQNIPFIVDLSEMIQAEQLRFMSAFTDTLYEAIKIPLLLMIDEAHIFAPQQRGDGGASAMLLNRMTRLQSQGRKRGIFLWLMTQRPARINKNAIAGTETLIVMKMSLKNDIEAIDEWLSNHDPEQAKMIRQNLTKLDVGEAFVWVPFAGFLERVRFPMHSTMDTGKTPEHGEAVGLVDLPKIDVSAIAAAFGAALTGDPKDDEIKDLSAALSAVRSQASELRVQLRDKETQLRFITNRETKLLQVLVGNQMRIGAAIGSAQIEPLHIDEPYEEYLMLEDPDGVIRPHPRRGDDRRAPAAARRRMGRAAAAVATKPKDVK